MRLQPGPAAPLIQPSGVSRRTFVQGLVGAGLLAGAGWPRTVWAAGDPHGLTARELELTIGELPVNFTGRPRFATVVNGSLPAPLLRWREGDEVRIRVRNLLSVTSSIHWHGVLLPAAMDGTPGLSFAGIEPGATFEYRFRLRQSGTYWYHSHSGFQEQTGLYGPLVIVPRAGNGVGAERDYPVVLSDWTDDDPLAVLRRLKKQPDYYARRRTVGDFLREARALGLQGAVADSLAWGQMRMSRTDLADVGGGGYTYLMNGVTPAGNWTALFRRGERVRLRFINAGAMTYFDVRIPGLPLTVVACDGQPVHPVTVDEFRIGAGETYDVIVVPPADEPYTVFAQSMDRSGFARGTLAPRPGLSAPVPEPDAPVFLSMGDMGHGGHGAPAAHAGGDAGGAHADPADHAQHAGHAGHAGPMDQSEQDGAAAAQAAGSVYAVLPRGITHAPAESGPMVDMRTDNPSARLDDPGIGLRDNGRRVLTYADLTSHFDDPDGREPGRMIELHLTGHMHRYHWSFNGVGFADAAPLRLRYGERLRIVLVNDGMMEHPIHLHGLWSDLEDEQGRFKLRKHTVSVKPGHLNSFRVTADALGRWAFHCHLMLHMSSMFRVVIVDGEVSRG